MIHSHCYGLSWSTEVGFPYCWRMNGSKWLSGEREMRPHIWTECSHQQEDGLTEDQISSINRVLARVKKWTLTFIYSTTSDLIFEINLTELDQFISCSNVSKEKLFKSGCCFANLSRPCAFVLMKLVKKAILGVLDNVI